MNCPAIIIDLDGTLVNNGVRIQTFLALNKIEDFENEGAFWNEVFRNTDTVDLPNEWCMDIVNKFAADSYKIIFMTGRGDSDSTKSATIRWLNTHVKLDPSKYDLLMRKEHDPRPDEQIKLDLLTREIFPKYKVLFAIDDKRSNIDLFRHWGIPALACADR